MFFCGWGIGLVLVPVSSIQPKEVGGKDGCKVTWSKERKSLPFEIHDKNRNSINTHA